MSDKMRWKAVIVEDDKGWWETALYDSVTHQLLTVRLLEKGNILEDQPPTLEQYEQDVLDAINAAPQS